MKTSKNKLYVGDNLAVMHGMNSHMVDLIYLDPPFNSKKMWAAPIGSPAQKKAAKKGALKEAGFSDIWVWNEDVDIRLESFLTDYPHLFAYIDLVGHINGLPMKAYLTFMAQRIIEMHRVLKEHGSLYLHCDPVASHYLKIILDCIFGKSNFRNEIVWFYNDTPGRPKKDFPRKHDLIFRYAKSKVWVFNDDAIRVPIKSESVERYKTSRTLGGKQYIGGIASVKGKIPETVWQFAAVKGNSKENTGYPTQKPLPLLDRIIKASSNEGDLVMDPFCGCATTCVAAHNLHRNWIGIDASDLAVDLVADRLTFTNDASADIFTDFTAFKTLPVRTDLEKLTLTKPQIRKLLYGEQNGNCNGCNTHFNHSRHFDIDHIYPEVKGGAWVLSNLQLLCGNCNSVKGDRPMEYLTKTIKTRRAKTSFY